MNGETPSSDLQTLLGLQTSKDEDSEEGKESYVEYIQVIGLQVGGESFIIDILNVREIVRLRELEITRVPHAHFYILGVCNLRGKVVPVVDLGTRLGLHKVEAGRRSRMIVVEAGGRVVGFTVDAVSEVLRLPKEIIEPPASREEYVVGVATVEGQIMTMLDLEKVLVS